MPTFIYPETSRAPGHGVEYESRFPREPLHLFHSRFESVHPEAGPRRRAQSIFVFNVLVAKNFGKATSEGGGERQAVL